jgi:DNA-binding CsgD family transcriptional regulator
VAINRRINALTQIAKSSVPASPAAEGVGNATEAGISSAARIQFAGEIGAAMAHELNGPMTALLLYIGEIQQNTDQIRDASLKRVIEGAYTEAERIRASIVKMGDSFESAVPEHSAINVARSAIAWWSQARHVDGVNNDNAGIADDRNRAGEKSLTRRQQEVLCLVSAGHSNKEGAALLKISHRTFEIHRADLMRKLGVRNTAQLVRLATLNEALSRASTEPLTA